MKSAVLTFLILGNTVLFATAHANNVYQYADQDGQILLTNIQKDTDGNSKFTQIAVTYYPDTKLHGNNAIPDTYNPTTASTPSRSANRNAYDHLIRAAAARHGVDPALVKAIIHTESAFNPSARSPVGAMGLMQLMPATARDMGIRNAYDPAQNIEGGVKYIAWLKRQFGNLNHVIAAYNAGLGNVRKYGGIPPFRETQNYVRSVNGRYNTLYKHDRSLMAGNTYVAQAVAQPAPTTYAPQVAYTPQPTYTQSYTPPTQPIYPTPQTTTITGGAGRIYISNGSSTLQR